jgi:hypothetical protein
MTKLAGYCKLNETTELLLNTEEQDENNKSDDSRNALHYLSCGSNQIACEMRK